MDTRSSVSAVQGEACLGVGVVGDFCAAVGVDGGVGIVGGDDLDAARAEERAKASGKDEGKGFFRLAGAEMAAGVVAAVGCVQDHDEASGRWCRSRWGLRDGNLARCRAYRDGVFSPAHRWLNR
jgi:hypothetical protein